MNVAFSTKAPRQALELHVASVAGRSVLSRQYAAYPFHLTRPFHLDAAVPSFATIYVQSSSGGYYGGDDLLFSLVADPGTDCEVTTQASTIVHEAKHGPTLLRQNLAVGEGAFAALWPDPTILLPGACLVQHSEVLLAGDASLLIGDAWLAHDPHAAGRVFEQIDVRTVVKRDGQTLVAESQRVSGDAWPVALGSADWRAAASAMLIGPTAGSIGAAELMAATEAEDVLCGASALPNDAGLGVRLLARDGIALSRAMERLWQMAFVARFGVAPARRRK